MPDKTQLNEGRVCFSSLLKTGPSPRAGNARQWHREESGHSAPTSREQTAESKWGQATLNAQGTPPSDSLPAVKFRFVEVPGSP